jgi:hypothetical protein
MHTDKCKKKKLTQRRKGAEKIMPLLSLRLCPSA